MAVSLTAVVVLAASVATSSAAAASASEALPTVFQVSPAAVMAPARPAPNVLVSSEPRVVPASPPCCPRILVRRSATASPDVLPALAGSASASRRFISTIASMPLVSPSFFALLRCSRTMAAAGPRRHRRQEPSRIARFLLLLAELLDRAALVLDRARVGSPPVAEAQLRHPHPLHACEAHGQAEGQLSDAVVLVVERVHRVDLYERPPVQLHHPLAPGVVEVVGQQLVQLDRVGLELRPRRGSVAQGQHRLTNGPGDLRRKCVQLLEPLRRGRLAFRPPQQHRDTIPLVRR